MRRWPILLLIFALVAVGAWGYWERSNRLAVSYALEADYQREFYDLVTNLEQAEAQLNKSLVTGSPGHNILYLTDVWNRAFAAQSSMSQLPFKEINLSASRKFLAQLGDFVFSLAEKEANGERPKPDEERQLARLTEDVASFNRDLHQIEQKMASNNFRWADTRGRPNPRMAGLLGDNVAFAEGSEMDGFLDMDKRIQELPTMVYDGPFSDHLQQKQPMGLEGAQISQEQALERARDYLDVPGVNDFGVTQQDKVNSKIPAYGFTFRKPGTPGTITMNISQTGGHLLWLLHNRAVATARLDVAEAREKALNYLESVGMKNMKPTYTLRDDHIQVFTFARVENGVLLYPDQAKVQVALDNGQVVGFDAVSYFMNHHDRKLPKPKLDRREAEKFVKKNLQVENSRLTLIPLDAGDEVVAWEFKTNSQDKTFLVYINAINGDEEKILQLIDEPHGQLAM